jgi:hypothetical protein
MLGRFLRRHLETIVVAAVVAAVTAGGPALARTVADFARNADKVDGKHAVGSGASIQNRKGDLVATNARTGRLPNNIIGKAPNSELLDGRDSAEFIGVGTAASGDLAGTFPAPDIAPDAVTSSELSADSVGGSELAADSVGGSELAAGSVRGEHLGFTNLAISSVLVQGNTPRNGNYNSATANIFCAPGQRVLGGGGYWVSTVEDTGDVHIVSSRRLRTPEGLEGWSVTGGSDLADDHFLFVEAYCLAA